MSKYIFLSFNIHMLGGGQTYLNTKTEYLNNNGYEVFVFSKGLKFTDVPYKNLKKYNMCSFYDFNYPPMMVKKSRVSKILKKIKRIVKPTGSEIIIESCDDVTALWGEIIAKNLNCKHFCFSLNESFEGKNKFYMKNLDFFKYKFERNELAFISEKCINLLFGNSYDYVNGLDYVLRAHANAVEDIDNRIVDKIKKYEINIAYIGRYNKSYVGKVLEDLIVFCKNNNKEIGLIFVGDAIEQKKYIKKLFNKLNNVNVFFTGTLIPIPKKIFSKFDVIIAGAGCAVLSYRYTRYVIVPDSNNYLCNGVLGFDTMNTLFLEDVSKQKNYYNVLEDVLIKKNYENKERHGNCLYKEEDLEKIYNAHFEFVNHNSDYEYYDVEKYSKMKKSLKLYFTCVILDYLYILNPILFRLKKLLRRNK